MMADVITGLWAAITVSAALGFVALALATLLRRRPFSHPSFFLGLVSSALWLVLMAWFGPASVSALSVEAVRNLSWLWFMASLWSGDAPRAKRISTVGWVYIGLFALQAIMLAVLWRAIVFGAPATLVVNGFATVQMLVSAGALVLLHNLFESTRTEKRHALGLPLSALGLLWAYDLNLYAITYLSGEPAGLMVMLRPMVMFAIAALFGLALLRPGAQAVQLSRPAAFRSLALAGIGGWLGILSLLALLLPGTGYDFGGLAQIGVLAATVAGAGLMLLSPRMRAHLRVWTAKHFYEHRYDYRAEWLRFTATLNRSETVTLSIDARVIKALADIVESPAGILVLSAGGASTVAAIWPSGECRAEDDDWSAMIDWMGATARIVQLDEVRSGEAPPDEIAAIPAWLVADTSYWVAVPLVHLDHVEALVVLARPAIDRALDWEDFDLLRVAGRQAASHIAEARGSEALAESARFDEFHRRFAFMMHDVKNLASQMALLSRNAERHGEKPEFREDMVMTLRLCADRLSQLMQRLSHQERISAGKLCRVDLAMIARRVADTRRSQHPVEVVGMQSAEGWGDRAMIEQLLAHLVQNAIEASAPDDAVLLRVGQDGDHATLRIEDKGKGMSPEFVRSELFRPFHSTKEGGFGVGAYQARQLAEAMAGTLSVESREGAGTIFTLSLSDGVGPLSSSTTSEAA
ncbi:MAG: XrtA/PEP-CTERM system histidine kinase PrsK [Pseudomonadota bacterium]